MSNRDVTIRDYTTQRFLFNGDRELAVGHLRVTHGVAPDKAQAAVNLAAEYLVATDFPEYGVSILIERP